MNKLKDLLEEAHYQCCKRSNISSIVLLEAYVGSKFVPQALSAAISCFGDHHAPIHAAFSIINDENYEETVKKALEAGYRIPGWGSDFIKGASDPVFEPLHVYLLNNHEEDYYKINNITYTLHKNEKMIYPNAAMYTAVAGRILGYSAATVHFLLVECRIRGWLHTIDLYEKEGEYFFLQGAE